MPKYIWKEGQFVSPSTGEAMAIPERPLQCPTVIGDIPAYKSPVTGEWVDGRRARRYDLEKHDCVDAGDFPRKNGGKVKSKKFAAKHNLPWQGD